MLNRFLQTTELGQHSAFGEVTLTCSFFTIDTQFYLGSEKTHEHG